MKCREYTGSSARKWSSCHTGNPASGFSRWRVLDAGAEDFSEEEDSFEILTDPDNFEEVRKALEDAGIPMISAEVTMIPQNYVTLTDETAVKNLQRTLDLLEDDDDVQAVYHNWDE